MKGTLWIFDELVAAGLLTPKTAAVKLRLLLSEGSFLPRSACDERLERWAKE